jgi:predicted RNA-binding protein with PIN domain
MPYLIDGHNLIPKIPELNLRDIDDEIQLIKVLQDFCRQRGKRVEVYFDNAPPGGAQTRKYGLVTAHFIRQGWTADAAIRSRLRKIGPSVKNWTVVTSDREVAAASREAQAMVISADDFAHNHLRSESVDEITPEIDATLSLDPDSVDEWLKIFGANDGGA